MFTGPIFPRWAVVAGCVNVYDNENYIQSDYQFRLGEASFIYTASRYGLVGREL